MNWRWGRLYARGWVRLLRKNPDQKLWENDRALAKGIERRRSTWETFKNRMKETWWLIGCGGWRRRSLGWSWMLGLKYTVVMMELWQPGTRYNHLSNNLITFLLYELVRSWVDLSQAPFLSPRSSSSTSFHLGWVLESFKKYQYLGCTPYLEIGTLHMWSS